MREPLLGGKRQDTKSILTGLLGSTWAKFKGKVSSYHPDPISLSDTNEEMQTFDSSTPGEDDAEREETVWKVEPIDEKKGSSFLRRLCMR